MKKPRALLLSRHAPANDKLDALREQVIAAECGGETRSAKSETRILFAWLAHWREMLWPNPKAWAGLAAVWAVILGLQFAARDTTPILAQNPALPSPQVIAALQAQRRLLAELIGPSAPSEAVPPKSFSPRPRSEVRDATVFA